MGKYGNSGTNGMDDRAVPVRCTRWTRVGRAWCVGDLRHESFVAGADDVPAKRNLHFSLSSEQGAWPNRLSVLQTMVNIPYCPAARES